MDDDEVWRAVTARDDSIIHRPTSLNCDKTHQLLSADTANSLMEAAAFEHSFTRATFCQLTNANVMFYHKNETICLFNISDQDHR